MTPSLRHRLRDTSGASIIIALLFFLICGIVGSIVLTAASVNAKAVDSHRQAQLSDYAVSSAAQVVVGSLTPVTATWNYADDTSAKPASAKLTPGTSASGGAAPTEVPKIATALWGGDAAPSTLFEGIWDARAAHASYVIGDANSLVGNTALSITTDALFPVYGKIIIDQDFNIRVDLSLSQDFSPTSGYNETITIPCIPTYSNDGKLLKCEWETATIQKATSADQGVTP